MHYPEAWPVFTTQSSKSAMRREHNRTKRRRRRPPVGARNRPLPRPVHAVKDSCHQAPRPGGRLAGRLRLSSSLIKSLPSSSIRFMPQVYHDTVAVNWHVRAERSRHSAGCRSDWSDFAPPPSPHSLPPPLDKHAENADTETVILFIRPVFFKRSYAAGQRRQALLI